MIICRRQRRSIIALILGFFTKFDSFAGLLCHTGWRWTYDVHTILSPSSSLSLFAKRTNAPRNAVSAIAEHLVGNVMGKEIWKVTFTFAELYLCPPSWIWIYTRTQVAFVLIERPAIQLHLHCHPHDTNQSKTYCSCVRRCSRGSYSDHYTGSMTTRTDPMHIGTDMICTL